MPEQHGRQRYPKRTTFRKRRWSGMNAPVLVAHLGATCRDALKKHFAALPPEDRCLRFCMALNADAVVAYVDRIDFARDSVFGVHDDDLALIGVAHVAIDESAAELGVSVLPTHRDRGIGGALLDRAIEHARNRFVPALRMHCLTRNPTIMHMARRSGMDIVVDGDEADAHLTLPPATPASITGEVLTDSIALFDYSMKQQVARWTRISKLLTAARPRQTALFIVRLTYASRRTAFGSSPGLRVLIRAPDVGDRQTDCLRR